MDYPKLMIRVFNVLLVFNLGCGSLLAAEERQNIVPPPEIPPRVQAFMDGSRQMLTRDPVRIIRNRQSIPALKQIGIVEWRGVAVEQYELYAEEVLWDRGIRSLAFDVIHSGELPNLEIDIFGQTHVISLLSFESIGVDGGVFFGEVHVDDSEIFARVRIMFDGFDYQVIDLVTNNDKTIHGRTAPNGYLRLSLLDDEMESALCEVLVVD